MDEGSNQAVEGNGGRRVVGGAGLDVSETDHGGGRKRSLPLREGRHVAASDGGLVDPGSGGAALIGS